MFRGILTTLGIISMIYGVIIGAARSGSKFFLVWIALGVILIMITRPRFLNIWNSFPQVIHYIVDILLTIGLILLILCEGLIISRFSSSGQPGLDYLIVLGAQMHEDGPSRVLQYRLDAAAEYLEENASTLCIVSGGKGSNETASEAEGMKTYLVGLGIAEDRILLEDQSTNTLENILYSMELLDPETDSVGIVTNNFHVYRAVSIAEKQGIRKVYGIAAGATPLYLPTNLFREFFGVLKDRVTGHL